MAITAVPKKLLWQFSSCMIVHGCVPLLHQHYLYLLFWGRKTRVTARALQNDLHQATHVSDPAHNIRNSVTWGSRFNNCNECLQPCIDSKHLATWFFYCMLCDYCVSSSRMTRHWCYWLACSFPNTGFKSRTCWASCITPFTATIKHHWSRPWMRVSVVSWCDQWCRQR